MKRLLNIAANLGSALGLACVLVLASAIASGQSSTKNAPPLLLAKLKTAKKIFVAPVKEDGHQVKSHGFGWGTFSYAPYYRRQIEDTLSRLYELVPDGAGADLAFEPSIAGRFVRVAVRDAKTQGVLWMFSREIKWTLLPFEENNVNQALAALLDDLLQAAGQSAVPAFPAQSSSPSAPFNTVPYTATASTPETTPSLLAAKLNSAQKVFIAPVSGNDFRNQIFFQDEFTSTVRMWRLYQLAPAAPNADLVFEPSIAGSVVRVVVRDAKTRNALWLFRKDVKHAILPDNADRNFAQAVAAVLDDLRQAAGQPVQTLLSARNAPPATQPASAPKVFISNVAGGTEDATYNTFYGVMKSSGRFDLVTVPGQADLIFDVWYASAVFREPRARTHHEGTHHDVFHEREFSYDQVKLVAWDRRTRNTLLAATEEVEGAFRPSTLDRNFSKALAALVNKAELAVAPPGAKLAATPISLPDKVQQAPYPSQIVSANKVFVAMSGGGFYPGYSAQGSYNAFRTALKDWGRYELVSNTADADLVLDPWSSCLSILDPETSIVLWTLHCGDTSAMDRLRALEEQLSDANPNGGSPETGPAGKPNGPGPPSVTSQLAVARKVYLSDKGSYRYRLDEEDYALILSKAREAIQAWGKYQVTASAAEADLAFEFSLHGRDMQVTIRDARGLRKLGVFTQKVQTAVLYTNQQRNIGEAAIALMESVRQAEAQGSAAATPMAAPALQPQ